MIAIGNVVLNIKVIDADSPLLAYWQMKKALAPIVDHYAKGWWDSFFTDLFSINNIQANEV